MARCQPHLFLPLIGDDISLSLSNGTILAVLIVFYTCNSDFDLSGILTFFSFASIDSTQFISKISLSKLRHSDPGKCRFRRNGRELELGQRVLRQVCGHASLLLQLRGLFVQSHLNEDKQVGLHRRTVYSLRDEQLF